MFARMKLCLLLSLAVLAACAPPTDSETDPTGCSTASTGSGGAGGETTTSSPTCGPGLGFDPHATATHHLGGKNSAFPSGTLLAARFEPFASATLAAPLVYLFVDDAEGCEIPDEVLSAAWTEPDGIPVVDPPITQSLISPDMVKPTEDPRVFRVRLDPVLCPAPETFGEFSFSAVLLIPRTCPALYSPSCDSSNGFLRTVNDWSPLSVLADASPGLGLYTDP